jgi:hypothetical protein
MSSKRKKPKTTPIAEYTQTPESDVNRKFSDRYGHVYHALTFGDPDGPEDDNLEILFSRIDPPVYGEDSHEILIRFPENRDSVVFPRRFLVMMLADGWNGELSGCDLSCDSDHDDNNITEENSGCGNI